MSSTQTTHSATTQQQRQRTLARPGKATGIAPLSTPNLNSLYSAHSRFAPGALSRKASQAALTPGSLATIPDDTESYAHSILSDAAQTSPSKMRPTTPSRSVMGAAPDDLSIGDCVDVPGNMFGTVRFVGSVGGRKGVFAGVELHPEFVGRGKNNGDVNGVSYFTTRAPGAGIFVPIAKLTKRDSPPTSAATSSFPLTPGASSASGLKVADQNATNLTSPTPTLPKFSKSVGPGARAPSPAGKSSRPSLARPESPARRLQLAPAPRALASPAPPASARYGSPSSKFAQSVRGTAGDPSKPPSARKPSITPRSTSSIGHFNEGENKVNGMRSMSSMRMRSSSRAAFANDEETERLRGQLEERDRQLKEQAAALAEMESSVAELTSLMESTMGNGPSDLNDKDTAQLRAMLREKNEKIALLTAEFDAHRADFRSTIDTLELASTETQRVYDARIQELEMEIQDIQDRNEDVDSVAQQLRQLEELVQELEEGLEDARRGEAEARGEVEFLRGEVERTRSELRREREKASEAVNGVAAGKDASPVSKELEKKEDEIRGLKAIIHSMSRDSHPDADSPDKTPTQLQRAWNRSHSESVETSVSREKMERELRDLQAVVVAKNSREEELEREIEVLRRGSANTQGSGSLTTGSTDRDSRSTVNHGRQAQSPNHKRAPTMDTMPESDAYSSVTESSTLWCEICETSGHDILTCTNVFGPPKDGKKGPTTNGQDTIRGPPKPLKLPAAQDKAAAERKPSIESVPMAAPPPPNVRILPNPTDSGPLAGKDSGVVDPEKWCALCERDGHDSIDCPLEDAF